MVRGSPGQLYVLSYTIACRIASASQHRACDRCPNHGGCGGDDGMGRHSRHDRLCLVGDAVSPAAAGTLSGPPPPALAMRGDGGRWKGEGGREAVPNLSYGMVVILLVSCCYLRPAQSQAPQRSKSATTNSSPASPRCCLRTVRSSLPPGAQVPAAPPQLAIASFEISRVSNCLTTTIMNGMDTALTGHYVRACMPRPERGRQCVLLGALQPSYNHPFDCDYVGGLYWRHWSVCLL